MSGQGATTAAAVGCARRSFSAGPSSPSLARSFVRHVLAEWDLGDLEDVLLLLTSELATNVVLHARSEYDVVLDRGDRHVRLTVLDDSPAGPVRRRSGLRSATGRGLALVDTLAEDWGRTEERLLNGRAKGIWCDIPLAGCAQIDLDEGAIYGTDWLAQLD